MVRGQEATGGHRPVLVSALDYAKRGWRLIPLHSLDAAGCCTCRHSDCQSQGKHPRTEKGLKDASNDPAVLDAWFNTMYPSLANIAVVTGAGSGVVGLDIDPRHGGDRGLKALIEDIGGLPETLTAKTGGGGLHLFFQHPGYHLKNAQDLNGYSGVDFKGDDGYLCLTPSLHVSGQSYEWANDLEIALLPPKLASMVRDNGGTKCPTMGTGNGDGDCFIIEEGQRNAYLTGLAGAMRRRGAGYGEIFQALTKANEERCRPPLLQKEIANIARSVCRYPPNTSELPSTGEPTKGGLKVVSVEKMLAVPDVEKKWVVDGLLPVAGISVVSAKPKTGKSTWIRNMALAVARGDPFMGRDTTQGDVLYLAIEEIESEVRSIFRAMGATTEPIFIHVGTVMEATALRDLEAYITAKKITLAVVDPLFKMMNTVRDISNYAEVTNAIARLADIARRTGCHVCCLHHNKKGGWQPLSADDEDTSTEAVSGSNAISGGVDTTVLMRRMAGGRRVVRSEQRYRDIRFGDMPDTVVGFDPNTYLIRVEGSVSDIRVLDCQESVLDALGSDTLSEVAIKNLVGYNESTVGQAIRSLMVAGRLTRIPGNVPLYKVPTGKEEEEDGDEWIQL